MTPARAPGSLSGPRANASRSTTAPYSASTWMASGRRPTRSSRRLFVPLPASRSTSARAMTIRMSTAAARARGWECWVPLGSAASVRAAYGEGFSGAVVGRAVLSVLGQSGARAGGEREPRAGLRVPDRSLAIRGGSGFDNKLTNLIDFDFNTFTNVNVGKARSQGVEGSVAFAGARTEIRANATFLDARDEIADFAAAAPAGGERFSGRQPPEAGHLLRRHRDLRW